MKQVHYKHVEFGGEFTHQGIKYIKTNYNRGYEWVKINNRSPVKNFRIFKKKTLVEVEGVYYE